MEINYTSTTTFKTALKTCAKDKSTCEKVVTLLNDGIFYHHDHREIIEQIRGLSSIKNAVINIKDLAVCLLNNENFYNNAKDSETRELLDLISGSASKLQDKNNGNMADIIKRPFIYREDVKRVSTDTGRSYDIPGLGLKSWPSVTGVYGAVHPFDPTLWINKIKRENPEWGNDLIEQYMEEVKITAAARGSMMHEAIETYLKDRTNFNLISNCELAGRPYFKCIFDYIRYEIDTVIAIEPLAYIDMSEKLGENVGCMGYIDLIGTHEGKNVIYDWKTADKPKQVQYIENYFIQVSAYAAMVYCTYGLKIDEARLVVAIKGKSQPQVFTLDRDEISIYLKKFLNNLKKYKALIQANES